MDLWWYLGFPGRLLTAIAQHWRPARSHPLLIVPSEDDVTSKGDGYRSAPHGPKVMESPSASGDACGTPDVGRGAWLPRDRLPLPGPGSCNLPRGGSIEACTNSRPIPNLHWPGSMYSSSSHAACPPGSSVHRNERTATPMTRCPRATTRVLPRSGLSRSPFTAWRSKPSERSIECWRNCSRSRSRAAARSVSKAKRIVRSSIIGSLRTAPLPGVPAARRRPAVFDLAKLHNASEMIGIMYRDINYHFQQAQRTRVGTGLLQCRVSGG
jgi:hypothetical protein